MKYNKPKLISEIGCNHKGSLDIAFNLVELSKESGADIVKFQKRHSLELLSREQYASEHPNPINSYGKTYGEHREFLEFSLDQHIEIKNYCKSVGIEYSTSVWDITSAEEIIKLNPSFIKIPSACNTNFDMLSVLADEYENDIHLSLGMTTRDEEKEIINFFDRKKCTDRLVIYACTSGYPISFNDACLLEISRLTSMYGQRVKSVGYSGHHLGIAIDIAAYSLGAVYIERHFTKDRTWKGTDHAASLEPSGLSKLSRDLKATYSSLTYKTKEILDVEMPQKNKLKWNSQL